MELCFHAVRDVGRNFFIADVLIVLPSRSNVHVPFPPIALAPARPCAVLVATRDRCDFLLHQCVPAIRRQTSPPTLVVIVNDGGSFSPEVQWNLRAVLSPIPTVTLENRRVPGAAGAWNTGLEYLQRRHDGFVALLDDDDDWDAHHLEMNQAAALRDRADVVISGLRRVVDGVEIPRPLVTKASPRDFLIGNPGWQGSNTFASMSRFAAVRGFRDGLASLNDRDLAFRILQSTGVRMSYTGEWTSSWHVSSARPTLSTARSPAKISGLRWFWRIYGRQMTIDEAAGFFRRAHRCFGVVPDEILFPGGDLPPHTHPHGDLAP